MSQREIKFAHAYWSDYQDGLGCALNEYETVDGKIVVVTGVGQEIPPALQGEITDYGPVTRWVRLLRHSMPNHDEKFI